MTAMRLSKCLWLVPLAGLLVSVFLMPSHLMAGCIGPTIKLDLTGGPADGKVFVAGAAFFVRCIDTGINGEPLPPMEPAKGIRLYFVQGDRKVLVGTVDADRFFDFSTTVMVPSDAAVGKASFAAERFPGDRVPPVPFLVTK